MEDVEMDVIIAKENIQLWPGAPLLRSLETEFQPKWEELKDTLTKNKIEEFAIDIEKLGIEYRYFQLTQWGKKLAAQAGRGPTSMPCRKLWRGFRIRSRNLKTKGMPNTSAV